MELRRSSMSHLGEEDTNWIRACIIESYVAAQVLGSEKVITMIIDWLRDNTPKEYKKYAHHLLILHGRYVCKARNPECYKCIVNDLCLFKNKNFNLKKNETV